MSSFTGLSVALSALHAQRARMDISNQNVSNVNTEGYTRQRVDHEALAPVIKGSMHGKPREVGDGVKVAQITRMMDEFALKRMRGHEATNGYYKAMDSALNEIEVRFNEPGDKGLNSLMGDFFGAWGDVANNPGDSAPRIALIEEGRTVAAALRDADAELEIQYSQTIQRGEAMITDVNAAAKGIAKINEDIRLADILGVPASELRDERDLLINKLSAIADVRIEHHMESGEPNGQTDVFIDFDGGTVQLVNGKEAGTMSWNTVASARQSGPGANTLTVTAPQGASPASATFELEQPSGQMAGLLETLNNTLPDVQAEYDEVAAALMSKVNGAQNAGFGVDTFPPTTTVAGADMFSGSTAADINIDVAFEPKHVAASSAANEPYDNAAAIDVSGAATAADGPIAKWQDLVGEIGVQASGARVRMQSSEVQLADAQAILDSSVGVDIDEEMTNLLTSQRAYEAASRMMTAVDEMLNTIINRMGRVGL